MTATIHIISINSKIPGLEGKLLGRDKNFEYNVQVSGEDDGTVFGRERLLEEAFRLTNADDRPHGCECCSSSVGDIFVLDGNHYLVAGVGFEPISPNEAKHIQTLSASQVMFGDVVHLMSLKPE